MIAAILIPLLIQDSAPPRPALDDVRTAGRVIGLEFTDEELELMVRDVGRALSGFERLRAPHIDNSVVPATTFSPLLPGIGLRTWTPPETTITFERSALRPADLEDLAFADIPALAALVRAREVTCVELAELFLGRLERYDPELHFVIAYTRERALAQAAALDRELDEGVYRGILHGIPWGAKDLLAVAGTPTTWGAKPFEDQVLELDAAVVQKLDAAGAVLVAKLSLGALAMGDVWFGARTNNPWDVERGSSGSSAGPASATAAGCVPFAIGSETLGSIVSPSTECGNSSLRPTFGRVSRHGAMALSWTMDKLGPLCRSAQDAAIVFAAIQGPDGRDPTVYDLPFEWTPDADVTGWTIGVPKGAFEGERSKRAARVLEELEALGVGIVEVELPEYPVRAMLIVLHAEAAAAFDELTRSGHDDLLVRQGSGAWPNRFRVARLIPAVEYIRAQRLRTQLMLDMDRALAEVDVLVHPSFAAGVLTITNLTGHPTFVAPAGFTEEGRPWSISFTGHLFDEGRLVSLAHAWQRSTGYQDRHPTLAFGRSETTSGGSGGR
ncbi:MAG: amidase [Planctomycetota bacterium]|nr:MAG: amidase [Planctomycetota bacterium]